MTDDELARRLHAATEPRPLPPDLREALTETLRDVGLVDALTAAASPRHLPRELQRRLILRRRWVVAPGPALMRVAAVLVAVLLVAGTVAAATLEDDDRTVIAQPPVTSTTRGPTAPDTVPPEQTTTTAAVPPPAAPSTPLALIPFDSCVELLSSFKSRALGAVGAFGLPGDRRMTSVGGGTAAGTAPDGGASVFSATNVQEEGVDEADIVKTDGRRIFHVGHSDGSFVRVIEPGDGKMAVTGVVRVDGAAREILITGDRLIVFTNNVREGVGWAGVWIVDVSGAPSVLWSQEVEGTFRAARSADGLVRLVVHTYPKGPQWSYPADHSEAEKQRAERANRSAIERSRLEDWVPRSRVIDHRRGRVSEGTACACDDTMRTNQGFTGYGQTTVLTVDPQRPEEHAAAAVQGASGTVYASHDSLYSTTWEWSSAATAAPERTAIHRFALPRGDAATYVGTGSVPGMLLNQFSMSEHAGHLRVASTIGGWPGTESVVTVLRAADLREVGAIGGLGRNERIYAVRFIGPTGYVVTFRQTDPLYVLDLSRPSQPRMTGELKIPGYSAYLHPFAAGHLFGVGQDATEDGRRLGSQVSVFDVSDPGAPRQTHRISLGEGTLSTVEQDHRAFLYWQPTHTMVLPLQKMSPQSPEEQPFVGVVVLRAGADGLAERGRLTHQGRTGAETHPPIERSLVIGDRLYTLSHEGVLVSDLVTLDDLQWLPY